MVKIDSFLKQNANRIIDHVGHKDRTLYDEMLLEVMQVFPTTNTKDKVHHEIVEALMQVFWIGCLSRQKEKRRVDQSDPKSQTVFSTGTADQLRELICSTFDAGKEVGETRP